MPIVSLSLFKKHTRADDFDGDDDLLVHYLEAAEERVVQLTNRPLAELLEAGGGTFPPTLRQAVMLLAAHWYNQREDVSGVQMHGVPEGVPALVKRWRKFSIGS